MFKALSAALANVHGVKLPELPRMADFAIWVVAAEPALPWKPRAFLAAYTRNRAVVVENSLEGDVVAVARKLEFLIQGQDHDVQLHPVVLSRQQTIDYALPRTPIKDTERRKNGFENQHGQGATELDALEALHPGALKNILTRYIRRFYDTGLGNSVMHAKDELYDEQEAIRGEVLSEFEPEIEQLRQEYKELRTRVNEQMSGYQTSARQLWHAISAELEQKMPDIEEFPVPEPQDADEIDGALYDSSRDYFEQLKAYREWRNGGPVEQERQNDLV